MSNIGPETLRLQELLLAVETAETPADSAAAITTIETRYQARRSVLVGDMEGFTARVLSDGVVPFIATIYRMRRLCTPLVAQGSGYLFKADADNLFAAFDEPIAAVGCALEMQRVLRADARYRIAALRIGLGIGIATGDVLAIGHEDVWGTAINVASKLGEDVACSGEILVDEATLAIVRGAPGLLDDVEVHPIASVGLSGVDLRYTKLTLR